MVASAALEGHRAPAWYQGSVAQSVPIDLLQRLRARPKLWDHRVRLVATKRHGRRDAANAAAETANDQAHNEDAGPGRDRSGAFAALPPSTWHDIERLTQGHLDVLEEAFVPAAEHAANWFDDGEGALGDAFAQGNSGATLSGSARVIDGDTLEICGMRIRLHGIDAPESAQRCRAAGRTWPCGREATRALSGRIAGRMVVCEERDRDRYGRSVAVCRAAGEDVNAWMVAAGWAFAYRK